MSNDNTVANKFSPPVPPASSPVEERWKKLALQVQQALAQGKTAEAWKAFQDLHTGTTEKFLPLVRAELRNEADAEDIVAKMLMEFYQSLQKPEPINNVTAFMRTVMDRRIIDFRRRRSGSGQGAKSETGEWLEREVTGDDSFWDKQSQQPTSASWDSVDAVDDHLFAKTMAPILQKRLAPELWEVLIKRHVEELDVAETALALGISVDQVKKRTRDAIKEARRIIQSESEITR